ncbi:MAG: UDP-N-acetylmuramoyl-L-alanine--D-glutamate ligase [Pseudomonadota bacterium]
MFPLSHVRNKKYAVFGLGTTGLAACEALNAGGAQVFSWDERKSARQKTSRAPFRATHPTDWPWNELEALVLSPGVPLTHPKPHVIVRKAAKEQVPVIGDIELFAQELNAIPEADRARVIAVTGSNGKSTTTALIGHILNETGTLAHVGGNIGEAVLSLPAPTANAVYVLELSSYQLDLCHSLRANVAVFLNLSPDHLDRHGTMERYAEAKSRIFLNRQSGDKAIIGVGDVFTQALCSELTARAPEDTVPISATGALGKGIFALGGKLYYRIDNKKAEAGDISSVRALRGDHNAENAAAALAAVMSFDVLPSVAVRSMERFKGLPHRMETVAIHPHKDDRSILFVNDSKATNVDAVVNALRAYSDIYWIAGGRGKVGGVGELCSLMGRVRRAYLIGEAADAMQEALQDSVDICPCETLENAVAAAFHDSLLSDAKDPVVLLSPACASQDQFRDFVERGEAFKLFVREQISLADANPEEGAACA